MKRELIEKFRDSEKTYIDGEIYEGESIEDKVARITENGEPITDGAPLVYTKRSDGVLPQYDVRTDKWELAQEKMSVVTEAKRNKIKESMAAGLGEPVRTEEPKKEQNQE